MAAGSLPWKQAEHDEAGASSVCVPYSRVLPQRCDAHAESDPRLLFWRPEIGCEISLTLALGGVWSWSTYICNFEHQDFHTIQRCNALLCPYQLRCPRRDI